MAGVPPYQSQWAVSPAAVPSMVPPATVPVPVVPPNPLQPQLPPEAMMPHRPQSAYEEVRTIFISGLPDDVKEREIQNLLRWLPGYEASQINYKGELPMGFALFSTAALAIAAKEAIQDMIFDNEKKSVLHTEMAKKNLFVRRGVVNDSNAYDQSKRPRTGGDYGHVGYPIPGSYNPPAPVWGAQGYMPPGTPYDPYSAYPVPQMQRAAPAPFPAPSGYAPVQNMKDNPPCNTLFIGNLGENTIEEELQGVFSGQPGFKQMKVLRQERNTVCFIEFEDLDTATAVHHNLQGAVITSSDRGGMRIQFSKNPFGKRKDRPSNGSVDLGVSAGY